MRIITNVLSNTLVSILGLFLLNLFDTKIVTKIVTTPSLTDYANLQELYPNTLKCFCSNTTIPYQAFVSFSPRLHSVCSSDLISHSWLSILQKLRVNPSVFIYQLGKTRKSSMFSKLIISCLGWDTVGARYFQLLSSFCQLANTTIDDSIDRFLFQSFITTNVLSEIEFNNQLNIIIYEFIQSTIAYFTLSIDLIHLFVQVDQPLTLFDTNKLLISLPIDDQSPAQVVLIMYYN